MLYRHTVLHKSVSYKLRNYFLFFIQQMILDKLIWFCLMSRIRGGTLKQTSKKRTLNIPNFRGSQEKYIYYVCTTFIPGILRDCCLEQRNTHNLLIFNFVQKLYKLQHSWQLKITHQEVYNNINKVIYLSQKCSPPLKQQQQPVFLKGRNH